MTRLFLIIAALTCWLGSADATMFVPTPFPDLVKEAPTIVRGKIGTSYSDWVTDDGVSKRIYTYYRLAVQETFKGSVSGGMILIRELGGEKDGVGLQISGVARFSAGEDVVVFLGEENKDGSYDVHGLASGKFNLSRQENGDECLSGIGVAPEQADGISGNDAPSCAWTVASLRSVVRSEGDAPKTVENPRASPRSSPGIPVYSPAPQLQPSSREEVGSNARGQDWILVLALGLAGLLAVFLLKPKR